jgi:predicted house-cleaning noncanonical NTP pyrophosphatase (MazG superfamily)
MKPEKFGKLKYLIIKEIEESKNLEDLQGKLEIIQKTIHQMRKPKRKIYPVKTLTKKKLTQNDDISPKIE